MKPLNPPQPIPYQGSKRLQVPLILAHVPRGTRTFWEPFVGSGAVTIGASMHQSAKKFVIGDTFEPLIAIWRMILEQPSVLCDEYENLWTSQMVDPKSYYDGVRQQFNLDPKPWQLLYLVARCVKNAIRFNAHGKFNQSPDHRRLGMRPDTMRKRVFEVHELLKGRATSVCQDYSKALQAARSEDVVYMDPPYMGVSGKRDSRYHQGLDYDRFVDQLSVANSKGISYMVSFDGRCGNRVYGPGLPATLGLTKIDVHVGVSSQSTLNGGKDETVESLYLSAALARRLSEQNVSVTCVKSLRQPHRGAPNDQLGLFDSASTS